MIAVLDAMEVDALVADQARDSVADLSTDGSDEGADKALSLKAFDLAEPAEPGPTPAALQQCPRFPEHLRQVASTEPVAEPAGLTLAELKKRCFPEHLRQVVARLDATLADLSLGSVYEQEHAAADPSLPTVVLLSLDPDERMSLLQAGNRRCPGSFFLVPTPQWLEKRPSRVHPGKDELYLLGGFTLTAEACRLVTLATPRRVSYVANFLTTPCTDGKLKPGDEVGADWEQSLACPVSSSRLLEAFSNCKVWTRLAMLSRGCSVPYFAAVCLRPGGFFDRVKALCSPAQLRTTLAELVTLDAPAGPGVAARVLAQFCRDLPSRKFVIKPSGPRFMGSKCVSIWDTRAEGYAEAAALAELERVMSLLGPGDAVLLDEFVEPLAPSGCCNIGFRLRTLAAAGPDGEGSVVSAAVCGCGDARMPLKGDNTVPMALLPALRMFGVPDAAEVAEEVRRASALAFAAVAAAEQTLAAHERGPAGARTDFLGFDICLTRRHGRLVPVFIEVNDHDCTNAAFRLELCSHQPVVGASVAPWVERILCRSQYFLLAGSTLLVVGAGGTSKLFVWDAAKAWGVRVVLVDAIQNCPAAELVADYLFCPAMSDLSDVEAAAQAVVQSVLSRPGLREEIAGVLTVWEDCGPLAACVADLLGLQGNPAAAHAAAKSKQATQARLRATHPDAGPEQPAPHLAPKLGGPAQPAPHGLGAPKLAPPYRPGAWIYSARSALIADRAALERVLASGEVPLPALFKLEHGSSAAGCKLVESAEQARAAFAEITASFVSDADHPGCGLSLSNNVVLTEYVRGLEVDLDIVVWDGHVRFHALSANAPTNLPLFLETVASMPAANISDAQVGQLLVAAETVCATLGLRNGVFNTEWIVTPCGPKVIDVNARMGGFYLRDWIRRVHGVDMLANAMMIACNVFPPAAVTEPRAHVVGFQVYKSQHEATIPFAVLRRLAEATGASGCFANLFEESWESADCSSEFEEPVANVACLAADHATAAAKLLGVMQFLGVEEQLVRQLQSLAA